jgi:hypothetical protein
MPCFVLRVGLLVPWLSRQSIYQDIPTPRNADTRKQRNTDFLPIQPLKAGSLALMVFPDEAIERF